MYTYDLENDLRYKQGAERGIEKGILIGKEQEKYNFIKNLILNTDLDDSKIASLVGVSEVFVANIRKELDRKESLILCLPVYSTAAKCLINTIYK